MKKYLIVVRDSCQ